MINCAPVFGRLRLANRPSGLGLLPDGGRARPAITTLIATTARRMARSLSSLVADARSDSSGWCASLLPSIQAAVEVAGRREAGFLGGLHRHRGALAIGAVEQQALAGRFGELMKDAAAADVLLQRRV